MAVVVDPAAAPLAMQRLNGKAERVEKVQVPCSTFPLDGFRNEGKPPVSHGRRCTSAQKRKRVSAAVQTMSPAARSLPDLEQLPDDVLCRVTSHLDVTTLNQARCVNKRWKELTSRNDAGWTDHCQRLWRSRLHVSPQARMALSSTSSTAVVAADCAAREAYAASCLDGRRTKITANELCYNPLTKRGTVWSFRFKACAGPDWTAHDPWHAGGRPRRMVFLRDGRVLQIDSNGRPLHPFADARRAGGVKVRWRKVNGALIEGETGGNNNNVNNVYIRLRVDGRDVPTYLVHRHGSNWGFLMENCWGVFASFPLPRKDSHITRAPIILDTTAPSTPRRRKIRKLVDSSRPSEDAVDLLSDASLPVTSRVQWREALLHNQGYALPDGPDAAERFNRFVAATAWTFPDWISEAAHLV